MFPTAFTLNSWLIYTCAQTMKGVSSRFHEYLNIKDDHIFCIDNLFFTKQQLWDKDPEMELMFETQYNILTKKMKILLERMMSSPLIISDILVKMGEAMDQFRIKVLNSLAFIGELLEIKKWDIICPEMIIKEKIKTNFRNTNCEYCKKTCHKDCQLDEVNDNKKGFSLCVAFRNTAGLFFRLFG